MMTVDSRDRVRQAYSQSGAVYDESRINSARGNLLSNHDVGMFDRLLPNYHDGMNVLEVGAGTGRFTLAALRRGYRLIATDVNVAMLDVLRGKIAAADFHEQCHVHTEDIFALSFPSNHFDFVFCLHMIPRLLNATDQKAAILELSRVVKPGGTLLFNYRNSLSIYSLIYRRHAIGPVQLERMLQQADMQIIGRRTKHVINRQLLNRLPVCVGKALAALDRSTERMAPRLGWDVFVKTLKHKQLDRDESKLKEIDNDP